MSSSQQDEANPFTLLQEGHYKACRNAAFKAYYRWGKDWDDAYHEAILFLASRDLQGPSYGLRDDKKDYQRVGQNVYTNYLRAWCARSAYGGLTGVDYRDGYDKLPQVHHGDMREGDSDVYE